MHNYIIPSIRGGKQTVAYDSYEDALNIVNSKLEEWAEDIEKAWMSSTSAKNKYDAENKIKFCLDCLAYLLLQASHNATRDSGVTSLYKEKEKRRRELPYDFQSDFHKEYASEGDTTSQSEPIPIPEAKLQPVRTRRVKTKTRSNRRKEFLKRYGLTDNDLTFTFSTVDTDNRFRYDGRQLLIDDKVVQYQPKEVKGDTLYDMDQIVICDTRSGDRYYLDTDFNEIEPEHIIPV